MQTKAVLFDMDGLMFDTERMADKIWISLAPQFGYTITRADVDVLRGRNKTDGEIELKARLGAEVPYEAWWQAVRAEQQRQLDIEVPLRPKLRELLAHLEGLGMPLAVVSSSHTQAVKRNLQGAGLTRYFKEIIGGDMVTHSKPKPEIYRLAASMLGVAPQDCLVLEDSYNGCRAGYAAGCRVIMVPDCDPPTQEMHSIATAIVEDLQGVIAYL